MSDAAAASPLPPVITVDGPSGTGKGTLRARIAAYLNWHMLDSGALYRALGWWVDTNDIDLTSHVRIADAARVLDIRFSGGKTGDPQVWVGDAEVTNDIRTESCGKLASVVASIPEVRAGLLDRQRLSRRPPGLVADGRDMGTVVFPDAILKIFLTANAGKRAERRHKQLKEKGIDVNLARLFAEIEARDLRDRERAVAPLVAADDAFTLDSSDLSIEEVEAAALRLIAQRGLAPSR